MMAQEEPIRAKAAAKATDDAASAPAHKPKPAEPCAMVIFGASGDLTKRLLVPALYNLARTKVLPENFALIGVSRGDMKPGDWAKDLHDFLQATLKGEAVDEEAWSRLAKAMIYVAGDVTADKLYADLGDALAKADKEHGTKGNAIFYLAVADKLFGPIVDQLGKSGLAKQDKNWRRVVIEKPFGNSYASAKALNRRILNDLGEDQIFRIDHFLGKDAVQAIMAFRFANGLFEPIWNRDRIDHVQITVAETVGVEKRGEFYEATGALRDMVPNHVLALLSMVAMEPPVGFDEQAVRSKKADVLCAMPAVRPQDVVRGQYGAGTMDGKQVKAYRDEPDVARGSKVETYVAMKLEIDNWRWAGVPFYVRTGKHLSARNTEIAICFKQAPFTAFQDTPVESLRPNWLVLRIQPNEGISLQFEVKKRGPAVELAAVKMDFKYDDWFPKEANVGYETLIYDVMIGDPTLFMRADMVEQGWRIVQPALDAEAGGDAPLAYESGSDGPKAADALIARDGNRAWRPAKPQGL
jgi:glucose-6-phosphate 1-dehydrogenase